MAKTTNKNISELARKTQERNMAEEERLKAEEQKNNDLKIEQKQKAIMFNTAFVPKWFSKLLIILFFLFSALFISYLVINYPAMNTLISIALILASLALSALLAFGILQMLKKLLILKGKSNLKHFPFNPDYGAYKDILSTEFFNIKLILRIIFKSSVPKERQNQITDALQSLIKGNLTEGTEMIWTTDEQSELLSPVIRAYKYHHPGGYEPYNREIHLWFKAMTREVLTVIHREYPLKQVNFSIEKKNKKEIFFERKDY